MSTYFRRVISASLSPNTEGEDVWRACAMLFTPWRWKHGTAVKHVRSILGRYIGSSSVQVFDSGRSALYGILHAFGIGVSDQVIVQAFTCVAVPNSVLWTGAVPVYADIDGTYNLDPADVEKKITPKTKAIIVQHTFGIPANMEILLRIARKHNLLVIEDCAHALGGTYNGKRLGTLGDAAFMSFGRDKALSSVWGGAAVIRARHKRANQKLIASARALPVQSAFWIFQQLVHPLAFFGILPLYNLGAGKLMLVLLQKLRLLSMPVFPEEKRGEKPRWFPSSYPNALAYLLELQLKKLDAFTSQRRMIARFYAKALAGDSRITPGTFADGGSYLRFPVRVPDPARYRQLAKTHGILLGNWYHNIIDPEGTDYAAIGYQAGSCPAAERAAREIINLPTRITTRKAEEIVVLFRTL